MPTRPKPRMLHRPAHELFLRAADAAMGLMSTRLAMPSRKTPGRNGQARRQ